MSVAGPSKKTLRVVAVDDNLVNQLLMRRLLATAGCDYVVVASGEDCLEEVRRNGADVVFMDISMPGMDGMEATRRIREMEDVEQPRIYALTASVADLSEDYFLERGFDGYIAKPLRPSMLLELLDELRRTRDDGGDAGV